MTQPPEGTPQEWREGPQGPPPPWPPQSPPELTSGAATPDSGEGTAVTPYQPPQVPAVEGQVVLPAQSLPPILRSVEMSVSRPLTPEETVATWLHRIRRHAEGTPQRYYDESALRKQLAHAYQREMDSYGNLVRRRDVNDIERRARLLGSLLAEDFLELPRPMRREILNMAYEVAQLVMGAAESDHRIWTANWHATHDSLTGILNRRGVGDKLEAAIAAARGGRVAAIALLYMDLDGFKGLNDTFGHEFGDKVLQAVATRLDETVRDSDSVARAGLSFKDIERGRLGGDEFLEILSYPHDTVRPHPSRRLPEGQLPFDERTLIIASRQERAVTETMREMVIAEAWAQKKDPSAALLDVGLSVGFVVHEGDMSADELLRIGDYNMYLVKKRRQYERELRNRPDAD
jgi:GGDEF domain-containing protein